MRDYVNPRAQFQGRTVRETCRDKDGRVYYRGKITLADGTKTRITIDPPKCYSKTGADDAIAFEQEREDREHIVYNAKLPSILRAQALSHLRVQWPGWRPFAEDGIPQVYLLANADVSMVKIGSSRNPDVRARDLHGHGWPGCHVVGTMRGTRSDERRLHLCHGKDWAGPQHDGGVEWFHARNELRGLVTALSSCVGFCRSNWEAA